MKKLIILLLFFAFAFTLQGCGDPEENNGEDNGKVVLSFWNQLTGADGSYMRQLVANFNKEYEGRINVQETYTLETDYYRNLNLLVPMGKGPDIAIMHSYLVQSYANRGIIMPIEDYLNVSGISINPEDYIADVFNSLYFEDKLYAIPLDIHTVGIYYNKDLLDKYDLEVPKNRQELLAAAKTVQDNEEGVWGLPLSTVWPSEWIYTTALYQNNGSEIDAQGNPAFNSEAGEKAMSAVADIIHKYHLSPLNLGVDQDLFLFQTGKALFHIQGNWMLNSMKETGINFGVIPMSNMFTDSDEECAKYIFARSHTFTLPIAKKAVSDQKKTAIMTFIKYVGDHSYIWATGGQIPASNIARATEEYQALEYLQDFGAVENFRVAPRSPYYHEAYSPVYSRITEALLKPDYDVKKLLAEAVSEAQKLIAEAKR